MVRQTIVIWAILSTFIVSPALSQVSSSITINAGTTTVTGGPWVLSNASSGGTLVSSLTLPSGLTAPSLTVTSAFTATGLVTNADLVNSCPAALGNGVANASAAINACSAALAAAGGGVVSLAATGSCYIAQGLIGYPNVILDGGTVGAVPAITTITPGTGFTIVATASDTSTYNYSITG